MVEGLTGVLRRAGAMSEICTTADGSRLVLLARGARVLGLFAADSDENYFWTNPALASGDAGDFFNGEGWHNPGGDRTWIAPEIDLSFPQFPDLNTYKVPVEIDPGEYELKKSGQTVKLVNRSKVRLFRSRQTVEVEINKSWDTALNPLRYENAWAEMAGVEYAGYTQKTSLKLPGGADAGPISSWSLVQLPHGGRAFFPLHSAVDPTLYFGSIPQTDLSVRGRGVCYDMQSAGIQKIGIRAAASTGRAGYLHSTANYSVLVVRNAFVNPSAEYIDVPWSSAGELGERGIVFQACNVNNDLGCFSELEYHAPAIGRGTGSIEYEDVSQVWAFRGSEESIRSICQCLLFTDF